MVDVLSNEVGTDDPLPADGAPDVRLRAPEVELDRPERIFRAPLSVALPVVIVPG